MTPSTEMQTAARKKRKTLYPHVILLIEGRIACMIMVLFPCFLVYLIIRELVFGWVAYFFTFCYPQNRFPKSALIKSEAAMG